MKRMNRLLILFSVFALVLAACGDGDGTEDPDETTTTAGPEDPEDPGTGGDGDFTDVDVSGTEVSVWGAPTGDEGDSIQGTFNVYGEATESEVEWVGSDSFEQNLRIAADGGTPPDIAITPQPGSICEFADAGQLQSLEDLGLDLAALEAAHSPALMALGQCADGNHYAIPTNVNYKSLVWYNKPAFDDNGYTVPETWDDLVALTEQMVSDGFTPWCIGLGSEAATGWPGTDWIEDIMVRTAGPDVYTQWWRHEIPFDGPELQTAFDTAAEIWFADDAVLGGIEGTSAIDFRDAPDPMFNEPPDCLMHRQASFIANFFDGPEGVDTSEVADFFNFPAIDTSLPQAALVGGEMAMVFNNRPEVVAFLEAYAGPELQCIQASPAGHGVAGIERISANGDTALDCYESDSVRRQAQAVADAIASGGLVFDGSDMMPSAVGQGSFWEGMVEWSRGTPTADILADIEASWPSE